MLGRDLLQCLCLDWKAFHFICLTDDLHAVLDCYAQVFQESTELSNVISIVKGH